MAERKTFQKNIRFRIEHQQDINEMFNGRDKEEYEYQGDLVAHHMLKGYKTIGFTDPYYLEKICSQRCLLKWGRHHICSRGGKMIDKDSKIKKAFVFKVGKDPLSLEGIIKTCSECINYGSSVLIDDKEIDKICWTHKLIKEKEGFVCLWGGPLNVYEEGKTKVIPRLFRIGKEALPLEMVRRICNSACAYTNSHKY